jgi:hypothetical protein
VVHSSAQFRSWSSSKVRSIAGAIRGSSMRRPSAIRLGAGKGFSSASAIRFRLLVCAFFRFTSVPCRNGFTCPARNFGKRLTGGDRSDPWGPFGFESFDVPQKIIEINHCIP